ncbi:hypothetical protein DBT_0771 [Dissulfuribacter thermophilus]|uniref:Uncharacterized protein n=1 Tax=Dissulfuribacter thermophilus TaxID=1156395 RepID=A0A1B9F7F0_9BACT|nr:hypothetical protein DBT_0771 [Dissulfuribacter thermophilus]
MLFHGVGLTFVGVMIVAIMGSVGLMMAMSRAARCAVFVLIHPKKMLAQFILELKFFSLDISFHKGLVFNH